MPDPYTSIAQADKGLQTRLADVLELRAADPQQRAMLNAYLQNYSFRAKQERWMLAVEPER
jgi:hypothetical protein